ncbi:hypothetical protein PIB30_052191 [Stylosanthes scabra]|uniref:Uncharacterized protein n=1 Tax=Stylosanthes scabra TaxID=79078 RepID=A0ABU6VGJ5_9FABA|nr:hypothetical protein [Stylosanthes scabra]
MYLRGVWDYRRNRRCQDGRLEIYRVRRWATQDWAGFIEGFNMCVVKGFGPTGPNIRNSCLELREADVSDVPGFVNCQIYPESRFIVMPNCESFFQKLLKKERQLDLMANIIRWGTWRERVNGPLVFVL